MSSSQNAAIGARVASNAPAEPRLSCDARRALAAALRGLDPSLARPPSLDAARRCAALESGSSTVGPETPPPSLDALRRFAALESGASAVGREMSSPLVDAARGFAALCRLEPRPPSLD